MSEYFRYMKKVIRMSGYDQQLVDAVEACGGLEPFAKPDVVAAQAMVCFLYSIGVTV